MVTTGGESHRESPPVHQVRRKKPAKEHDFLREKQPHPDGHGFFLLLHVFELVLKTRRVIMFVI
jgi:hypothetical protein